LHFRKDGFTRPIEYLAKIAGVPSRQAFTAGHRDDYSPVIKLV